MIVSLSRETENGKEKSYEEDLMSFSARESIGFFSTHQKKKKTMQITGGNRSRDTKQKEMGKINCEHPTLAMV